LTIVLSTRLKRHYFVLKDRKTRKKATEKPKISVEVDLESSYLISGPVESCRGILGWQNAGILFIRCPVKLGPRQTLPRLSSSKLSHTTYQLSHSKLLSTFPASSSALIQLRKFESTYEGAFSCSRDTRKLVVAQIIPPTPYPKPVYSAKIRDHGPRLCL
jgi:hypothetical protein